MCEKLSPEGDSPDRWFKLTDKLESAETTIAALTQRAEQAERERDELKAAAWCLDKPDDASHQETLNMIDELWSKKVAPITSLLDQSRALADAEAEVKRLREGLKEMEWHNTSGTYYCPRCWAVKGNIHKPNCRLADLLDQNDYY